MGVVMLLMEDISTLPTQKYINQNKIFSLYTFTIHKSVLKLKFYSEFEIFFSEKCRNAKNLQ